MTEKRIYEPPKITFVPLQPEERLLACGKVFTGGPWCAGSTGNNKPTSSAS